MYLGGLHGKCCQVVWVLFVPRQSEKRQLLRILVQYSGVLQVPGGGGGGGGRGREGEKEMERMRGREKEREGGRERKVKERERG